MAGVFSSMMGASSRRKGKSGDAFAMPLTERQQLAYILAKTAKEAQGDDSGSDDSHEVKRVRKSIDLPKVDRSINTRGETALHVAATKGDLDTVRDLIKQGADVNIKDNAHWAPLHEACNHGFYKIAKYLIKAGANVSVVGCDGDTPLHDASTNGHVKVVVLLLKHGADPWVKNDNGETPIDVAGDDDVVKILHNFTKEMLTDVKESKDYMPHKRKRTDSTTSDSRNQKSSSSVISKKQKRSIRNVADFLDTEDQDDSSCHEENQSANPPDIDKKNEKHPLTDCGGAMKDKQIEGHIETKSLKMHRGMKLKIKDFLQEQAETKHLKKDSETDVFAETLFKQQVGFSKKPLRQSDGANKVHKKQNAQKKISKGIEEEDNCEKEFYMKQIKKEMYVKDEKLLSSPAKDKVKLHKSVCSDKERIKKEGNRLNDATEYKHKHKKKSKDRERRETILKHHNNKQDCSKERHMQSHGSKQKLNVKEEDLPMLSRINQEDNIRNHNEQGKHIKDLEACNKQEITFTENTCGTKKDFIKPKLHDQKEQGSTFDHKPHPLKENISMKFVSGDISSTQSLENSISKQDSRNQEKASTKLRAENKNDGGIKQNLCAIQVGTIPKHNECSEQRKTCKKITEEQAVTMEHKTHEKDTSKSKLTGNNSIVTKRRKHDDKNSKEKFNSSEESRTKQTKLFGNDRVFEVKPDNKEKLIPKSKPSGNCDVIASVGKQEKINPVISEGKQHRKPKNRLKEFLISSDSIANSRSVDDDLSKKQSSPFKIKKADAVKKNNNTSKKKLRRVKGFLDDTDSEGEEAALKSPVTGLKFPETVLKSPVTVLKAPVTICDTIDNKHKPFEVITPPVKTFLVDQTTEQKLKKSDLNEIAISIEDISSLMFDEQHKVQTPEKLKENKDWSSLIKEKSTKHKHKHKKHSKEKQEERYETKQKHEISSSKHIDNIEHDVKREKKIDVDASLAEELSTNKKHKRRRSSEKILISESKEKKMENVKKLVEPVANLKSIQKEEPIENHLKQHKKHKSKHRETNFTSHNQIHTSEVTITKARKAEALHGNKTEFIDEVLSSDQLIRNEKIKTDALNEDSRDEKRENAINDPQAKSTAHGAHGAPRALTQITGTNEQAHKIAIHEHVLACGPKVEKKRLEKSNSKDQLEHLEQHIRRKHKRKLLELEDDHVLKKQKKRDTQPGSKHNSSEQPVSSSDLSLVKEREILSTAKAESYKKVEKVEKRQSLDDDNGKGCIPPKDDKIDHRINPEKNDKKQQEIKDELSLTQVQKIETAPQKHRHDQEMNKKTFHFKELDLNSSMGLNDSVLKSLDPPKKKRKKRLSDSSSGSKKLKSDQELQKQKDFQGELKVADNVIVHQLLPKDILKHEGNVEPQPKIKDLQSISDEGTVSLSSMFIKSEGSSRSMETHSNNYGEHAGKSHEEHKESGEYRRSADQTKRDVDKLERTFKSEKRPDKSIIPDVESLERKNTEATTVLAAHAQQVKNERKMEVDESQFHEMVLKENEEDVKKKKNIKHINQKKEKESLELEDNRRRQDAFEKKKRQKEAEEIMRKVKEEEVTREAERRRQDKIKKKHEEKLEKQREELLKKQKEGELLKRQQEEELVKKQHGELFKRKQDEELERKRREEEIEQKRVEQKKLEEEENEKQKQKEKAERKRREKLRKKMEEAEALEQQRQAEELERKHQEELLKKKQEIRMNEENEDAVGHLLSMEDEQDPCLQLDVKTADIIFDHKEYILDTPTKPYFEVTLVSTSAVCPILNTLQTSVPDILSSATQSIDGEQNAIADNDKQCDSFAGLSHIESPVLKLIGEPNDDEIKELSTVSEPLGTEPLVAQFLVVQSLEKQPLTKQLLELQPFEAQLYETQPLHKQPSDEQYYKTHPLHKQPSNEQYYETQPSDEQPAKTQPSDEQPAKTQPSDEQSAKTKPLDEQPAKTQPSDEQPAKTQPSDELPAKTQPSDEQPAKTQPSDELPAKTQPSDEQPAKTQPADELPAKTQPSDEQPAKTQPSDEQPAKTQPSDEQSAKTQPSDEQPAKTQPSVEQPAKTQPLDEQPAKTQPSDELPAKIQPSDELPAKIQPPDEQPAKTQPSVEQPAKTQPSDEQPDKTQPPDEQSAKTQPSDELPAKIQPSDELPAKIQPPDEQPAKIQPPDELPAKIQPPDEQPAKIQPPDEQPAKIQPSDEQPLVTRFSFVEAALTNTDASEIIELQKEQRKPLNKTEDKHSCSRTNTCDKNSINSIAYIEKESEDVGFKNVDRNQPIEVTEEGICTSSAGDTIEVTRLHRNYCDDEHNQLKLDNRPGQTLTINTNLSSSDHFLTTTDHDFRIDIHTHLRLKHEQYPGLISPSVESTGNFHDLDTIDPSDLLKTEASHDLLKAGTHVLLKSECNQENRNPFRDRVSEESPLTRCLSPDEVISNLAECIMKLDEHQNSNLTTYAPIEPKLSEEISQEIVSSVPSDLSNAVTFTPNTSVDITSTNNTSVGALFQSDTSTCPTHPLSYTDSFNNTQVFNLEGYTHDSVFIPKFPSVDMGASNTIESNFNQLLFVSTQTSARLSASEERMYSPKHILGGERLYSPRMAVFSDENKRHHKVDLEPCSILRSIINSELADIPIPIVPREQENVDGEEDAGEKENTKDQPTIDKENNDQQTSKTSMDVAKIKKIKRLRTWREAIKQRCTTVETSAFKRGSDKMLTPVVDRKSYNDILAEAEGSTELHDMLVRHSAQKEKLRVSMIQELARVECSYKLMSLEKGPIGATTVIYFQRDQLSKNLSRTLDFKNKATVLPDFKKLHESNLTNLQDKFENLQKTLLAQQQMEIETLKAMQKFEKYDYKEVLRKRYLRLKLKLS